MIALVALAVAGIPLVTALGYASAVAVLTAVLAALTLLPALLALLGHRIDAAPPPHLAAPADQGAGTGMWAGWGRTLTRHPTRDVGVGRRARDPGDPGVLSLNLGQEDIGATPTDTTERQAYDLMTEGFGVGYNGPLLIAVELGTPATTDPAVQKQIDQANALQAARAGAEGGQGQRAVQALARETQANALKAQQAQLEQQQARLRRSRPTSSGRRRQTRQEQAQLQASANKLEAEQVALNQADRRDGARRRRRSSATARKTTKQLDLER